VVLFRPQHDGPAACVIAQQCSSITFVSLRFHFREEKFGARLTHVITYFPVRFENVVSEIA
jgi:hypothetical protein